jgi:D-alanyl-D-alanine-carboxypeptidase/D-alanyl-D-alanine-endopeptidase
MVHRKRIGCLLWILPIWAAAISASGQSRENRDGQAEIPWVDVSWPILSGQRQNYSEVKTYLRDLVREFDIPAVAVAVVGPGWAVFLSEGFCDPLGRRAVTDKTVFRASRLGMLVFNYLVLRLAGEGFLKLNLPLAQFFPGGVPPDPEFAPLAADPRWAKMTARQVLVHKSGLEADRGEGGRSRFAADPGREFRFSDDGYRLLQLAVETLTGRSLNDLATELVFEPIGMTRSSYEWSASADADFACAETERPSPVYPDARIRSDAARSFLTCTNDLARFLQTVYRRGFRLDAHNLDDINNTTANISCRTISEPPGTMGRVMRAKGIYWSLLGGQFKNPWPGLADPYFLPGLERGCENHLVGFPERGITAILLSVPGRGGGRAREILKELIGDVYSPWAWMEYE